jgi:hypothetical protein
MDAICSTPFAPRPKVPTELCVMEACAVHDCTTCSRALLILHTLAGRVTCLLSDQFPICSQARQGQSIKILIVDYLKRKGVVSWQLFAGGENLVGNNTVSQTDTTVFALTGATISMLEVRIYPSVVAQFPHSLP